MLPRVCCSCPSRVKNLFQLNFCFAKVKAFVLGALRNFADTRRSPGL